MTLSNNKKVKIFGVPIDLGSEPLGVEMGAAAIRYAGLTEALKFNEIEFDDYGDLVIERKTGLGPNGQLKEIARVSEKLADLVSEAIGQGYIPIVLGGDHSASIGSIAGASKQAEKLGLIWLDCHPDANTPETSLTGNVHGMTVAISLGFGYPQLINCAQFSPKLAPENVCIIGAKDIDKDEKDFLDNTGVKYFTTFDIAKRGIVQLLDVAIDVILKSCDSVHLSFDVDVLDPLIAPGTGIISKGGLSYREISFIMETIGALDIISSIDIIEINPLLDIKNQTSELAVELLLSSLGGSYGDYERSYLR